jgi:hypothetical protein
MNEKNELLVNYNEEEESRIIVENIQKVRVTEFIAWFLACPKFISFEV